MIIGIIVACEIAFWVFLAAGLAARYLLRRKRLSVVLLVMAPLVDVVLLVATALSLRRGDPAGLGHALAAVYIGFSVAYGHRLIAWADRHFAYRFANGPKPERLTGAAYARLCWADVARTTLAAVITCGLTAALIAYVGDASDTGHLAQNYRWMAMVLGIEVIVAVSYTIWPRKAQPVVAARQA